MKQFNKLSMVLFDSTKASFKLSVEAIFTKTNNMGGFSPLAYVTTAGTGNLNPNIYLMFTYKSESFDKGNTLYTSYPQLFRVRETMEKIKNLVADESGFMKDENGVLMVRPECSQPIVLSNIGKQNKWLAFKLVVLQTTEEGVTSVAPAVSVEISSANGMASVLTVDEFLTVYTIIHDIDLASIQCMMSLSYIQSIPDAPAAMPAYQQPVYQAAPQYQQGQYRQQPQWPNNQTGYPQNNGSAPRQQYRAQSQYQQPRQYQNNQQQTNYQPRQQTPVQNALPPRENKPIMNLDAVEQTPVSEVNFDDSAAIDEIFN